MNPTSLTFALLTVALVAGTAWFIDWGARRSRHWNERKRLLVRKILLILALAAGFYVYFTDAALRGTTLFETAGPWSETGDRIWLVEVEHPGVEHTLLIAPGVPPLEDATRPVVLRSRFGVEGAPLLVDDQGEYGVTRKTGKYATGTTWQTKTLRFIPERPGPHQLIVSAPQGNPPKLHLRMADPEKRDGQRAKGY